MNVLINITYRGQSGNYLVNMDPGVDDATIKSICEEAVRSGEVPGVSPAIPKNAFANFVIDRFHGEPARFVVRPKVPFGINPHPGACLGWGAVPKHPGEPTRQDASMRRSMQQNL